MYIQLYFATVSFIIIMGSLTECKGIKTGIDFSWGISDSRSFGNKDQLSQRRNLLFRAVEQAKLDFSTSNECHFFPFSKC